MSPTLGIAAPRVIQHVAGAPTKDAEGSEVPAFSDRSIRVLAQYPGNSLETDNAAGDTITADVVLLVQSSTAVKGTDQFTLTDTKRYRVQGEPGRYVNPMTGTAVTQVNLRRIA